MKGRPIWFWALLSIIGLGALIVAGVIGFVVWQYREMKSFQAQADTHDLHARVQQMARGYLARRVNGALVIGVVQKGQTHWAGFGRVSTTNTNAPDAATLFEIGSVTKAFTGTALARMVEDGKLRLEDTVEKHLPPDLKLPDALRPITLVQLATHTAGLPRLPENLDL